MNDYKIADLSHWNFHSGITQAEIEEKLTSAKIDGLAAVISKCTESNNYVDPVYAMVQAVCKKLGLLHGAYHFGRYLDGSTQADFFLSHANLQDDTLIALDFEASMNITQLEQFVTRIFEKTGKYPVIYTRTSYTDIYLISDSSVLHKCASWIASYQSNINFPTCFDTWCLWQYTNGIDGPLPRSLSGFTGSVDLNWFNPRLGDINQWWSKLYNQPTILPAIAEKFVNPVTADSTIWLTKPTSHIDIWYSALNYGGVESIGGVQSYHTGVDLNQANDTDAHKPVYAVANGVVIFASRIVGSSWGNLIILECHLKDGSKVWFRYAHIENMLVKYGDIVSCGQQLAQLGNAFNVFPYHLHFDVSTNRLLSIGVKGAALWPNLNLNTLRVFTDPYPWLVKAMNSDPIVITPDTVKKVVIATRGLNIRKTPFVTGDWLGLIPYNTEIGVDLTDVKNGYTRVINYQNSINGYVLSAYLEDVK